VISVVDERRAALAKWLQEKTSFNGGSLSVASADASFRRYFRLLQTGKSYILMDAPPSLENSLPFVEIGEWMKENGLNVPTIYAKDLELGFMVLSDFGDHHFQDALQKEDNDTLYSLATEEICKLQNSLPESQKKLPTFSPSWQSKELEIFREWCLPKIPSSEYEEITNILVKEVDKIPKAFMHRDFHCRNLLLCPNKELGIIDFQGAMHGPVTYDLVSLLRDCYVSNDPDWVNKQVTNFQHSILSAGLSYADVEPEQFIRWFDLAGLQRHLKCVGIFHRLQIRDHKPEYMKDVPRVLGYIKQVVDFYPELKEIKKVVNQASILKEIS
jgi:aminoglycoside/choline kinase family phosphotransferase